jgi:tellurite resistance protein
MKSNQNPNDKKDYTNRARWFKLIGILILIGVVFLIWWIDRTNVSGNLIYVVIRDMQWPFAILVSVLILRQPIGDFLENLGESLARLRNLKIGENFTFTTEEIIEVLVDREKLKMGILIAMAEGGINAQEAEHLVRLAYPMKNEVQSLSKMQKVEVLEESINVALIDGEIQKQEYVHLKDLADLYNQDKRGDDKVDLDDIVARACYLTKRTPPEQLANYYSRKIADWEKEKQ